MPLGNIGALNLAIFIRIMKIISDRMDSSG